MSVELRPCPFCGHEGLKITKKRSGNHHRTGDCIQVICNRCKARGPIFTANFEVGTTCDGYLLSVRRNKSTVAYTEQLAIAAWNRERSDEADGWTRASERLPEKSGEYLVGVMDRDEDHFYHISTVRYSARHKRFNAVDFNTVEEATRYGFDTRFCYWMPTPKPPKKETTP